MGILVTQKMLIKDTTIKKNDTTLAKLKDDQKRGVNILSKYKQKVGLSRSVYRLRDSDRDAAVSIILEIVLDRDP